MRVVFMGTPDFAVDTLKTCIEHHDVVAVFTQPDKRQGRGKKVQFSPVKEVALAHDIPVHQPKRIKTEEWVQVLKDLKPDVCVVVAYGQIMSVDILEIPKYGCINVHASLLPKYRGAAPINWAIVKGETVSGVTTMYMDKGVDTGDMILKAEVAIDEHMTAGELYAKLKVMGADLLKETLDQVDAGVAPRQKQNHEESSHAPMMDKSLSEIKWEMTAKEIHDMVRGFNPWPVAYTNYNGDRMKVFKTQVIISDKVGDLGEILEVSKLGILVKCAEDALLIEEIQLPNKKRMAVSSFILGHEINVGSMLK